MDLGKMVYLRGSLTCKVNHHPGGLGAQYVHPHDVDNTNVSCQAYPCSGYVLQIFICSFSVQLNMSISAWLIQNYSEYEWIALSLINPD